MTLSPPNPIAWQPVERTRHEGYEAWTLPGGGTIYVRRTDAGLEAQWATDAVLCSSRHYGGPRGRSGESPPRLP